MDEQHRIFTDVGSVPIARRNGIGNERSGYGPSYDYGIGFVRGAGFLIAKCDYAGSADSRIRFDHRVSGDVGRYDDERVDA